jgi:hypothetical protein
LCFGGDDIAIVWLGDGSIRKERKNTAKLQKILETTMQGNYAHGRFGEECSFQYFCAQHLSLVQNYDKNYKKNWLGMALV